MLAACGGARKTADIEDDAVPETIELSSAAFVDGEAIPMVYTCQGDDVPPPLQWRAIPAETESLALIVADPDASVDDPWIHWIIYNMPPDVTGLTDDLPSGSQQGENSWGKTEYSGPCPPRGTHRYIFTVYALDRVLDLKAGATQPELARALEGHILAKGRLTGTYQP